jgi:hypothetical protein
VYADDDHVTVVSPSASVTAEADDETSLTIDATADAISSASIDVLTSASPIAFTELRVEAGARVARALGRRLELRGQGRGSHEGDYDAWRVGGGAGVELADRNLSLDLDYQLGLDRAGDASDARFSRRRTEHAVSLAASQVLDPRTVLDVIVEARRADGYHASPYRRVPIGDPAWPVPTWVDEVTPEVRGSLAVAARGRRAVGDAWFVTASQRLYVDDWSVTSHTTTLDVRHQRGDAWLLGATARGYVQGAAGFYRRAYEVGDDGAMPVERTRDRTLGPMRSAFASLTVDRALWRGEDADPSGGLHLVVATGVVAWWFTDSALQARRLALVTTASLAHSF